MDHEVGTWRMAISMLQFKKNQFTKLLGLLLGVAERGPRGMTMHQKMNALIFLIYFPKQKF